MTKTSDIALLGLRYYMPGIGRFTTRDPAGQVLLVAPYRIGAALADLAGVAMRALIPEERSQEEVDRMQSAYAEQLIIVRNLLSLRRRAGEAMSLDSDARGKMLVLQELSSDAYTYADGRPAMLLDARGLQALAAGDDTPRMLPWPLVCFQAAKWHLECIEKLEPLREEYPCDWQERWRDAMKNIPECRWAMEAWARCAFGSYPKKPSPRG